MAKMPTLSKDRDVGVKAPRYGQNTKLVKEAQSPTTGVPTGKKSGGKC